MAHKINSYMAMVVACIVAAAIAAPAQQAGQAPAGAVPNGEAGTRSNYITTGVSVSSTFDNNALNTAGPSGRVLDELVTINPHVQFQLDRPRTDWGLSYSPGFAFSQNAPQTAANSELLSSTFMHRFTPRLNLSLFNDFSITTSGYDQYQASVSDTNVPVAERPNSSLLLIGVKRQQSVTGGSMAYALDKHSQLTFGGSYTSLSFNQPSNSGLNLLDSTTYSAHAGYTHQRSARHTLGVEYSASRLVTQNGTFTMLSHTASVTSNFAISAKQSLSLFAGPQISTSTGTYPFGLVTAISFRAVSWTAGGQYSLQVGRNRIALGAVRQVSDGAGISPAVRLTSANLGLTRSLARAWDASLAGQYSLNDPLVSAAGLRPYQFWSAQAGVTRKFAAGMSFSVSYWRTQQEGNLIGLLPMGSIDHNRAIVTVAYDLTHSLGK